MKKLLATIFMALLTATSFGQTTTIRGLPDATQVYADDELACDQTASDPGGQPKSCTPLLLSSYIMSLDDVVGPDMLLSAGQTDEYCLTYEATGDTWEWAECGAGAGDMLKSVYDASPDDNVVDTAAALAANGSNCSAGEIPLGVDASGAVEGCYEPAEADISDLDHTATAITDGLIVEADLNEDSGTPTDEDVLTFDSTGNNFNWVAQALITAGEVADGTRTDIDVSGGSWTIESQAVGTTEIENDSVAVEDVDSDTASPTAGYVLSHDGAGAFEWVSNAAGSESDPTLTDDDLVTLGDADGDDVVLTFDAVGDGTITWKNTEQEFWFNAPIAVPATASPAFTLTDSDAGAATDPVALSIGANLTNTGDGTEDADVTMTQLVGGSPTAFLTADADGSGTARLVLPDDSIGIAEIDDAALSGLDTTLLTGTASSGECAQFDANGDLIGTGSACGSGGGYATVDDEDTPLTQRTTLNFEGAGVTCADDTDQTTCTIPGGAGTPGGSDTQVQFNDGGSTFGGDAGLTYNKTTDALTVGVGSSSLISGSATGIWLDPNGNTVTIGDGTNDVTISDGGVISFAGTSSLGAGAIDDIGELGDFTGCDGDEVLARNTGDTAWECVAASSASFTDLDTDYGNETITSDFDFGGGTVQLPNSTSLPANCDVGDSYMDTDATNANFRFYLCTATDTWTLQGTAGSLSGDYGAGAVAALTDIGDLCAGDQYLARNTGDTAWECVNEGSGSGDMTKAVYDSGDDGQVDSAIATAIQDGLIVEADLDEDSGTPTDGDILTYDSTGANFNWIAESDLTLGGDLSGSLGSAVVGDDSHAHGDSTIDGLNVSAITAGTLVHEQGGLEADVSGYTDGLYGQISGSTADIDTISEFDTALGLTGTADGTTFLRGDGAWATPAGSGDVVGPSSATDEAIARFDTTTGKLLQNSSVTISDAGVLDINVGAADGVITGPGSTYDLHIDANGENVTIGDGGTNAVSIADTGVMTGIGTGGIDLENMVVSNIADDEIPVGDAAGSLVHTALADCTGENHLQYNASTNSFSCDDDDTGGDGVGYDTIEEADTPLAQQANLNFIDGTRATMSCVDDAGDSTTDCTVEAAANLSSYTDDLSHVEESTTVTDNADGIDITLSTYDIAVALDPSETANQAADLADLVPYEDVTDGGIHHMTFTQVQTLVADGTGTDDQVASEVPFTPDDGGEWTGSPTEVDAALEDLAPRVTANDAKVTFPAGVDYLVGTASGSLSAEIVVGTSPGGELGGTWASPTIDDSVTVTGWVMGASTATTPSADDNDASLATSEFVQGEINGAGGTGLSCSSGQCNVDLGTSIGAGEIEAAAIDGDDINSNLAGTHLTLTAGSPDTLDVDSELKTVSECVYIEDPETDEEFLSLHRAAVNYTVTAIWCEAIGGTSVALDLEIDDGTPAAVNNSAISCTSTASEDSSLAGDVNYDDGDRMDLDLGTVTGTVTSLSVCWEATIDD